MSAGRRRRPARHVLLALAVVAVVVGGERLLEWRAAAGGPGGESALATAFRERRSNLWVESEGRVERLLADDTHGSRHQRFILRLDDGQTVLVSHNIDLAPRAPLTPGATVAFRGEYEWNERGGVVHWTHHDPDGRHAGGWLRVAGETYR